MQVVWKQFAASKMSRAASLGLVCSCLSFEHVPFKHVSFIVARTQFAGAVVRIRVRAKPATSRAQGEDVDTARGTRSIISFDMGPSLQRGRRLPPRQLGKAPEDLHEKSRVEINSEGDDARLDAFAETNLLNAKELVEKLVKEDGTVTRFVKGAELDRESFTRVFDLVAIRVLADECGVYVSRHLLNWSRVKNVQRVEGDDGDAVLKSLLWESN